MTQVKCPSCQGSGKVTAEEAVAIYEGSERPLLKTGRDAPKAATCSCDGPPHAYSPGWCPASGPVSRRV